MNKITQDVCKWQEEAFLVQKREFDKRSNSRTFGAGDIVYVVVLNLATCYSTLATFYSIIVIGRSSII